MVVTFYKTKMNNQNRCYGAEQYDSYLNSCEKLELTLSHDIIPNNPFNIATDSGMWSYNYITYTYKGYYFGAFINSISIQAISGTTVISHTTDTWYFALKNIGIENIDFHGKVMRGHVKDTDENHRPILDNTTLTAEEVFNNSNLKYYDFPNCFGGNDLDMYTFNRTWYLYIYFSNPSTVIELNYIQHQFIDGVKVVANNGFTCCYPVMPDDDGNLYIYLANGMSDVQKDIPISGLTNSNITSITLSKVPPAPGVHFSRYSQTEIRFTDAAGILYKLDWKENIVGLPSKAIAPGYMSDVSINSMSFYDSNGDLIDFSNISGSPIEETDDYDTYLKTIPKFNSLVYNPVYFGDSICDMFKKFNSASLSVALSLDLSSYIFIRKLTNLSGNKRLIIKQNNLIFAPDTVLDYWTRLNALQTANAGKIQENAAINQGISNTTNLVKKSAKVVSTAAKGVGSSLTLNIGKAITNGIAAAADTVSASADLAEASINYQRNQENANLSRENGQMIQEVAEYQYNTGQNESEQGAGYYNSYKAPTLLSIIDNSANYKQICTNLHRYGYNTFLQLDEVYFNHVREHFNYIKCSEVEVTGVTEDIASDIANMFLSGVHLWQDDVENFDRTNYSRGEWNV